MPRTKLNYRFNSFYDLSLPKFTQEMVDVLVESSNRAYRSSLAKKLPLLSKSTDEKYFAAIKDMADTARKSTAVFLLAIDKSDERSDPSKLLQTGRNTL